MRKKDTRIYLVSFNLSLKSPTLLQQRQFQHFLHLGDVMEFQAF